MKKNKIHTQASMIQGMNTLGRNRFSKTSVNGSNTEYEIKKIVSVLLNWVAVMFRSFCRPSIFAFPILVLARSVSPIDLEMRVVCL